MIGDLLSGRVIAPPGPPRWHTQGAAGEVRLDDPDRHRARHQVAALTEGDRMSPTRKWWAATVTAVGTEAIAIIQTGWHEATQIALVGLVVQRAVAWLIPNDPTTVKR